MSFNMRSYAELLYSNNFEEAQEYKNKNIPRRLYKFMNLSEVPLPSENGTCKNCEHGNYNDGEINDKKIDSILQQKLWMSTYKSLNDPFEMNTLYINENYFKKNGYPIDLLKGIIEKIKNMNLVGCFTTNLNNNLPMWAHYANNHKGICIEYEIINPKLIFPISYERDRDKANRIFINYISLVLKSMNQTLTLEDEKKVDRYYSVIHNSFCRKDKSWEYENEYRIFYPNTNNKENGDLVDNKNLGININSVYLGLDCSEVYKEKIKKIAKELKLNIFQMYVDETVDQYKLSYKKIY